MPVSSMTPTEREILTALRTFILAILPSGVEVVQGQDNRVPEPTSLDFVVMTPLAQQRLSTNVDTYSATLTSPFSQVEITADTQYGVQLDIHGPNASTYTMQLALLWRDSYATDNIGDALVTPLYADDPHQAPFINGENQYETRWVVTVYMQVNPVVTAPQESATTLDITLYEADQ